MSWTSARIRREAIAGQKLIKLTIGGGQDVVLDHSLAQSGIRAGLLAFKSTGAKSWLSGRDETHALA
jgi:hypothetical protein